MMILALVAFGLGVTILYTISGQLDTSAKQLNEQTKDEINRILLSPGIKVAFPKKIADVPRGDKHILGFGVKNTDPDYTDFKVETQCLKAYKDDNTEICNDNVAGSECNDCDNWIINNGKFMEVAKREMEIDNLFIKVPKDAEYGEYIFKLEVKKYDGANTQGTYDTAKRFYVRVG